MREVLNRGYVVFFVVALFILGVQAPAQESPTVAAMKDEMHRAMTELRMKGEQQPYFISYEVLDRTIADYSGRLGALVATAGRMMSVGAHPAVFAIRGTAG